jgi:hypothetical protein
MHRRGTRAHCIRVARERANSNSRRGRTAGAIAERHADRATGRLSRLGALLSAGNGSPVRSIPLLVRSLLLRTRVTLVARIKRPPVAKFLKFGLPPLFRYLMQRNLALLERSAKWNSRVKILHLAGDELN